MKTASNSATSTAADSYRRKIASYTSAVFLLLNLSCGTEHKKVSPAEKERRQDLATDLSGLWLADSGTSDPSTLEIVNEYGNHDIVVDFDLGRSLTAAEKSELGSSIKFKVDRIDDLEIEIIVLEIQRRLHNLTLGEGRTFNHRGGENIALDAAGLVTEIALSSNSEKIYETEINGTKETYFLKTNLYMTSDQESNVIDYENTRNTDVEGYSTQKTKGFFISISRSIEFENQDKKESTLVSEFKIRLDAYRRK